jgi:hypothetical protein
VEDNGLQWIVCSASLATQHEKFRGIVLYRLLNMGV